LIFGLQLQLNHRGYRLKLFLGRCRSHSQCPNWWAVLIKNLFHFTSWSE